MRAAYNLLAPRTQILPKVEVQQIIFSPNPSGSKFKVATSHFILIDIQFFVLPRSDEYLLLRSCDVAVQHFFYAEPSASSTSNLFDR